jgi:hypothetical protein
MRPWDATGFLASSLVISAFCMKDIVSLRLVALASNVAFFLYGIELSLVPVWLLHAVLLPVNGWRLWQAALQNRIATTAKSNEVGIPSLRARCRLRSSRSSCQNPSKSTKGTSTAGINARIQQDYRRTEDLIQYGRNPMG